MSEPLTRADGYPVVNVSSTAYMAKLTVDLVEKGLDPL